MKITVLQDTYDCASCIHAVDIYGRGCRQGLLLPVLLMMEGKGKCPHYKFDREKVEEYLKGNEHEKD